MEKDTKKLGENLSEIKDSLLENSSFDKLSDFFSLFGDSTRLTIICLLINNELCVNDITAIMGVSQSVVSHQLQVLRKHDIVDYRKEGKSVFYHLTDHHIKDLFSFGLEHVAEKDKDIATDKNKKGY